jgi:hypothetical protein
VELNSIVIVSLTEPKEKVWGQLLALSPAGITLRGIDLNSFDDWVRQLLDREETALGMPVVFYPMHRVERMARDEPSGSLPSLSDRFKQKVGLTLQQYLGTDNTF